MTQTITFSDYNVESVQPITVGVEKVKGAAANFSLFTFSLKSIYRKQLRAYRRMAQVIDRHGIISNLWIGGWAAACVVVVFLYT